MSKWEKVRLGDVIVIDKKQVEVNELDPDSIYIGLEHIEKDSGIITAKPTVSESKIKSSKFRFSTSHILYGKLRPYLNKVARPNFNGVCSTDIYPILVTNKANKNFVYYILRSPSFVNYASTKSSGANLPRINEKDVMEYQFTLPPLDIQKKIAHELDLTSIILDLQRYHLQELNQLIKSVFYEMFGDPVTNEKGWTVHVLGELITNLRYGTSTPPIFSDAGYCFIRATNIKLGRVISRDMRFIDENEATKLEKCKLHYGDLIIVRSGVNTGDSCVVLEEYAGHYAGYDIIVSPDFTAINPVFINELINTSYMDRIIKPLTRRAAQPHLNAEQVKNLPIITPPLSLQEKFAEIVDQIESQKSLVKQAIDETQRLFDSLMSKYFDD